MSTLANVVGVPCVIGIGATAVMIPNSAAVFRAPVAQPAGVATPTSAPTPTGPQRWPL